MKCDKLTQEAFDGIKFEYKLDKVIAELPKTISMDANDMYKYLRKKGVSPKEIEASDIMNSYSGDYPLSAEGWQKVFNHKGKLREIDVTDYGIEKGYDKATINEKGANNPSYKETLFQVQKKPEDPHNQRHYNEFNTNSFTNLGENRLYVDNIKGKDSTVLAETQSDWEQFQRDGYGTFKSKGGEINDFPISPKKFHQLNIVYSIDKAIQNGTNRVVIPIERNNGLSGEGVDKFYSNLISHIKDIQKKLKGQGLILKVDKDNIGKDQSAYILEITEIPNNKVSYDVYSILSALGLSEYAKEKEQ